MRFLVSVFVCFVLCNLATAQVPVRLEDKGMLFPATLEINKGGKESKQVFYPGGKTANLEISEGVHVLELRNSRFGFPQGAKYIVKEGDKVVLSSQVTYDPLRLVLKKGQVLGIEVFRPYESYNAKFGTLRGVPVGIVFARPYWDYEVKKGEYKGNNEYPNSLLFLVDTEKWGPKKVFAELGHFAAKEMRAKSSDLLEDYRCQCHVALMIGLTPEGKLPPAFLKGEVAALEAEIAAYGMKLYEQMLGEKCYRTFHPSHIEQMKHAGFLPKDFPDGPSHISFADAHKYAPLALEHWQKKSTK